MKNLINIFSQIMRSCDRTWIIYRYEKNRNVSFVCFNGISEFFSLAQNVVHLMLIIISGKESINYICVYLYSRKERLIYGNYVLNYILYRRFQCIVYWIMHGIIQYIGGRSIEIPHFARNRGEILIFFLFRSETAISFASAFIRNGKCVYKARDWQSCNRLLIICLQYESTTVVEEKLSHYCLTGPFGPE